MALLLWVFVGGTPGEVVERRDAKARKGETGVLRRTEREAKREAKAEARIEPGVVFAGPVTRAYALAGIVGGGGLATPLLREMLRQMPGLALDRQIVGPSAFGLCLPFSHPSCRIYPTYRIPCRLLGRKEDR